MEKYTKRISSFNFPAVIALLAIIFQNVFPVLVMNPFASSEVYAGDGSNYSYEMKGLVKGGTWTKGNLCQGGGDCYTEGENVPFKLEVSGLTTGGTYSLKIQRDYLNGSVMGYESISRPSVAGGDVDATAVSFAESSNVACGGSVFCRNSTITFTASAETAVIHFDGVLGMNASEWNGASMHMRLLEGIGGDSAGQNDIPISVGKILRLPSLTITKAFRGEDIDVSASDWCFDVSPQVGGTDVHCIKGPFGDSVNSLKLDNLPATSYTVTEVGPDGYAFVSVGGTNCTVADHGVATATVAPGTTATDATCDFINTRSLGHLKVIKDVVGPNGEDVTDEKEDFGMVLMNGESERFSLTDNGSKEWKSIPTGVYTVLENTIPDGYLFDKFSIDENPNEDGAQVTVTSGQETVLTVTNKQVGGTLYVTKHVLDTFGRPTDDDASFGISLDNNPNVPITDGETIKFDSLLPGSHVVDEKHIPKGYNLVGFDIDDDKVTPGAQIMIPNNKEIYLNVTNQKELSLLEVVKSDDVDPVAAGQNFKYTITAENKGLHTLHSLGVKDTLPVPFDLVSVGASQGSCTPDLTNDKFSCDLGDLSAASTATITVEVSVPSTTLPGKFENTAYITALEYPEPLLASEVTEVTDMFDLKVSKNASVERINAGDPNGFTYMIEVTNDGPSVARKLLLMDSIPSQLEIKGFRYESSKARCEMVDHDLTCSVPELGSEEKFIVVVHVGVPFNLDSQKIENVVSIGAGERQWKASDTVEVTEKIDLIVTKKDNVDQVAAGEGFIYTITVRNGLEALSDADNVILKDVIPAPFVATGVDNDNCVIESNTLECKWRHLDPGIRPEVINVTVRVPSSAQAGSYQNVVRVVADEDREGKGARVSTPVVENSSLWVRKTDSVDPVTAGGSNFIYTIGYGNNGPSDADEVMFIDHLPPQFKFVGYKGDPAVKCELGLTKIPPFNPEYNGRDALTCDVGTLKPGFLGYITIEVAVPESVDTQTVVNYADIVSSDGDRASVEESTKVVEDVRLVVSKWDQYDPGEFAIAGDDDAVYTIRVWNEGLSDADNVVIKDMLPAEFSYVKSDPRCTYYSDTHMVMCDIGTLPNGQVEELMIVASVDADVETTKCEEPLVDVQVVERFEQNIEEKPVPTRCGYLNVVHAISDEDRTSDEERTPVVEVDDITVKKSLKSDNPHVAGRDTVEYKVVVKNLGPSDAEGVEVWDDLTQILKYYQDGDEIEYRVETSDGITCEKIDFDNDGIYCYVGDLDVYNKRQNTGKVWFKLFIEVPDYFQTGRYTNIAEAWSGECNVNVHEKNWREDDGWHDECSWDEDKAKFKVTEESNITVEKIANPDEAIAGDPVDGFVSYPVKVTNTGPSVADKVVAVDYLPDDFTYISNDNDWCEYDEFDHAVYCTILDMEVDEVFEFSVKVFVEVDVYEGTYTNTAMAFSHECVPMEYEGDGEHGEEEEEEGEDFGFLCAMDEAEVEVLEMAPPVVDIIKSNDWDGVPLTPGAIVGYTVTVGVNDAPVRDLTIFDLLPVGLSYIAGTGSAVIDGTSCLVRPTLLPSMSRAFVGGVSVGYPDYKDGIGMWFVGNLDPCQKVILTYKAVVDDDATPGELWDISWTKALSLRDEPVYGQAVPGDPSYINENVVGTYVAIAAPVEEGGEVLGASTALPATGVPTYKTLIAIFAILSGIVLIFGTQIVDFLKKKRGLLKGVTFSLSFLAVFMVIGLFTVPQKADAQVAYIQMSTPKSPTSNNTFNISYVAANSDGAIDIDCKVSKDGGVFVSFDSASHNITGSGACAVNAATMPSEGSYKFKAVGSLAGGGTIDSNVVTVAYDVTKPEAPDDYEKEVYGACSNQVTFTVPEGSGIEEVRVYRSTSPSFTANENTLIIVQAVSEGEPVTLRDDITDCSQKYYYALRSIDASGNSSEYTGDHTAAVTQVTQTEEGVEIEQVSVDTDTEPELIGQNGNDGEVLGEEEGSKDSPENGEDVDEKDAEDSNNDEDSKESSSTEDFMRRYGFILLIGIGLIVVGFYLYRRTTRSEEI